MKQNHCLRISGAALRIELEVSDPDCYVAGSRGASALPQTHSSGRGYPVGFGQQLLELGVLGLQVPQLGCVRSFHASVLGAPFVKRGITEPASAAQLLDWHDSLVLLEKANDLFVGKSALLNVRLAPV